MPYSGLNRLESARPVCAASLISNCWSCSEVQRGLLATPATQTSLALRHLVGAR